MIERCRQRFPNYRFEHGDARDLSRFPSGSVDFAFFSFNGIDVVGHQDRLVILRQVRRVLAPGGVFAFSAHSIEWLKFRALWEKLRGHQGHKDGKIPFKHLMKPALRSINYLRYHGMQTRGQAYSILLDRGHDYCVPVYYVSDAEQRRQLVEAGYQGELSVVPEYGHDELQQLPLPYANYYVAR